MQIGVRTIVVLASLATAAPLGAADVPQTAEQLYKNIQVLKGVDAGEFTQAMNAIASALGVRCNYCHAPSGPWPQGYEKDEIKTKQSARDMIRMTRQINQTAFGGRNVVTCVTCHAGQQHPATYVPADAPEIIKAQPAQPARADTASLPTADELFAKYVAAIGGEAAVSKLTTRHLVGTTNAVAVGQVFRIEQFATSRDLILQTTTGAPQAITAGFDGKYAYTVSGAGSATIVTGASEDTVKLSALFQRTFRLKDVYASARTLHKEKLGAKDVYVVNADLKLNRFSDLLFFDVESGLLLRRTSLTHTPLGPFSDTIDFENYREVDGVKVSMDQVRFVPGALMQRLHIEEIHFNEPMDDAKFALPSAPTKQ